MTPKSKRLWLLRLAQAARRRLDETIEILEDGRFSDDEAGKHDRLVWDAYQALFGDEKTLRWLLLVRALEKATRCSPQASDVSVARKVLHAYGDVFPDLARAMDSAKLTRAVAAWRADRNYFDAIRVALVSASRDGKVPSARSMATKWSAATTAAPWTAPSKRRPRRRGSDERPRGVRVEDRRTRG